MTDTDCLDYSKVYSLTCLIFHPNKLRMNRLLAFCLIFAYIPVSP